MAIKFSMVKDGNRFVSADEMTDDAMKAIKNGAEVIVTVNRPRNPKHHRLFWAMLNKVVEQLDENQRLLYPTPESLLAGVKIALGYYDMVRSLDGMPLPVLKSTNFESMSQDEFRRFFNQAMDLILDRLLPVDEEDLRREIAAMVS